MPYQDYERQKEWARQRSRRVSAAGREIGNIPPIRDIARRIEAANSLLRHLLIYFPQKFPVKFSENHLRYIEATERKILGGGNLAIGMPRGTGKTAIEKGAVHWAIANSHRRYAVVIAANNAEATAFLDELKTMFLSETFGQDYPEITYPLLMCDMSGRTTKGQTFNGYPTLITVEKNKLRLPTITASLSGGNVIVCSGITGRIRGKAEGLVTGETLRPDLIIIDDAQTDEDAANPNRVKKIEHKINKTVKWLSGSGENIAMIMSATVIERDDLADRFLTPEIYPTWESLRFKMVEKFPDNMEIWTKKYAPLYLNNPKNPKQAMRFYKQNRSVMDAGAVVDWKERYDKKTVCSRLEQAMRYYIEDRESFFSECQNEPITMAQTTLYVDAANIRKKINIYPHGVTPPQTAVITAMIDVHDDLLYYAVTAWEMDMTGYVIDYGTFPEQRLTHFKKNDPGNIKLQDYFPLSKRLGAVREGITALLNLLTNAQYHDESNTKTRQIDRILIDAGYNYQIVETAIKTVRSATVMPSLGVGIGAAKAPMEFYPDKIGERKGYHWLVTPIVRRSLLTFKIDTNFWKTDIHDSLALSVGDKGGLSLYADHKDNHRLLADHVAAENVKLVEASGRKVYEWQQNPNRDNHFFDTLVGCIAAANLMGCRRDYQKTSNRRKRA